MTSRNTHIAGEPGSLFDVTRLPYRPPEPSEENGWTVAAEHQNRTHLISTLIRTVESQVNFDGFHGTLTIPSSTVQTIENQVEGLGLWDVAPYQDSFRSTLRWVRRRETHLVNGHEQQEPNRRLSVIVIPGWNITVIVPPNGKRVYVEPEELHVVLQVLLPETSPASQSKNVEAWAQAVTVARPKAWASLFDHVPTFALEKSVLAALESATDNGSEAIGLQAAAQRLDCPPHILSLLSTHSHPGVVTAAITNPYCPIEQATTRPRDARTAARIAARSDCPTEFLIKVAESGAVTPRRAAAANPATPSKVLERLAFDTDRDVRAAAANNPSTPKRARMLALTSL